jgi:hypothetical protein
MRDDDRINGLRRDARCTQIVEQMSRKVLVGLAASTIHQNALCAGFHVKNVNTKRKGHRPFADEVPFLRFAKSYPPIESCLLAGIILFCDLASN